MGRMNLTVLKHRMLQLRVVHQLRTARQQRKRPLAPMLRQDQLNSYYLV